MHRKLTLAFACALTVALAGTTALRAETTPEPEPTTTTTTTSEPALTQRQRQKIIDAHRHEVWRWQRLMGHPYTRKLRNPREDLKSKLAAWKRIADRMQQRAENPPHKGQWLCIHRYEGAWTSNTGNGYYGGLQMDLSFQRTYAPGLLRRKGTADRWTPLEQMWAAERAHRSGRGFYPWPNTARYCGLI